jgi:hypothetical protein
MVDASIDGLPPYGSAPGPDFPGRGPWADDRGSREYVIGPRMIFDLDIARQRSRAGVSDRQELKGE